MNVREVLNTVMAATGKSQAEIAASIEKSPQQLSQKMVRNSLRAEEMLEILDANGIEMLLKITETGEIIPVMKKGHGHRIKGMADRVIYDTGVSSAISNSFYADGVNEYDENGEAQELYVDQQGRYFIAEYNVRNPEKERVRAIPESIALAFKEKYGIEIEKMV